MQNYAGGKNNQINESCEDTGKAQINKFKFKLNFNHPVKMFDWCESMEISNKKYFW